ncbi:MAG: F0F1 ATP synthase subunit delta [Cellvibrionaceae bacterium]
MAELTTLARPYAKAGFEFAKDAKALDRWSNMLATVTTVALEPAVAKKLASPSLTTDAKGDFIVSLCGDDIDNKVANFLHYLAKNDRLSLLPQIRELFELLKSNLEKTVDVEITTAFEMTDEQQAKVANALKTKLEREVSLQTTVDQSLLGGLVVRAGDLIIDGSARGRLAKLAESMKI